METVLQILGVIFLVVICLLLLAVLWVAWKVWKVWREIKKLTSGFGDFAAGMVPPFRVELEKVAHPDWTDRDKIETLAGPLRSAGFVDVGAFDVSPSPMRLLALAHPSHEAYGVVYQMTVGETKVWLDLVSEYEDGRIATWTTSDKTELLDTPEFKIGRAYPDLGTSELVKKFLAERPNAARRPASAAEFPKSFEQAWAREFDWRIARGGVSDAEIHRISRKNGQEPSTEHAEMVKLQWRGAIRAYYQERLQEKYLSSGNISAQKWESIRDRVIFIHDQLSWDDVVGMCGLPSHDNGEAAGKQARLAKEAERLAAAFPPRAALERINQLLEPSRRHEKIGELTEPIPADVYLMPAWDEYDVEEEEDD